VLGSNKEDPHRYRHYRELALGHFVLGDDAQAVRIAARLVEQAPDLARNRVVLAALQAIAGQTDAARRHIRTLLAETPDLEVGNARLPRFGEAGPAERFRQGLIAAGLPG
jgi:hypothetical protein